MACTSLTTLADERSRVVLDDFSLNQVPCSTASHMPQGDGDSGSGCCCHFLPTEQMISLGSELAFSVHSLLFIVLPEPECTLCLNLTNILLIIAYAIQCPSFIITREKYFFLKLSNAFHLNSCCSWCNGSTIEIGTLLLLLTSEGKAHCIRQITVDLQGHSQVNSLIQRKN